MMSEDCFRIGTRVLHLDRLEKVLYSEAAFSKKDVIQYYRQIAPVLLPHIQGRPLTVKRYPDGVNGHFIFEKSCPSYRPSWLKTLEHAGIRFCSVADEGDLLWLINIETLELHASLSRAPRLEYPSSLLLGLDPALPTEATPCAGATILMKALLEDAGLRCFAKTSGTKGFHIVVPLNPPTHVPPEAAAGYEQTAFFARAVTEYFQRVHPQFTGQVLLNPALNDVSTATLCAYSLCATSQPSVSTPVTWEEIEMAAQRDTALQFRPEQVVQRIAEKGDLFAKTLFLRQELPTSARRWLSAA